MASRFTEVTGSELSILEVLWTQGESGATVREIVMAMYGRHEHSLHAGVKSLLERLMEKGFLNVDKSSFAHRFTAEVSKDAYVASRLREVAEAHYEGSLAPMIVTLLGQFNLSKKDRAAIEKIIQRTND